jgi:hypothetical protein
LRKEKRDEKMSFEVFICYKELTGAKLAENLREALMERKIKAFVAHKDIPTKTKYSVEWCEIRNRAIQESQTFVMLVTWLFEDSQPIIEEINLAKKYEEKDFMIFRRKQQSNDISMDLGNDVMLHLKNKQQIPFEDSGDLINLFLDEYAKHEKKSLFEISKNEQTENKSINESPLEISRNEQTDKKEELPSNQTPLIHYQITQSIQNTILKRSLPDVGFNIRNWNSYPLKAKVEARVILDGVNLGLIKGSERMGKYLGYYDGKTEWNLNPYMQVFGHFTLHEEFSKKPNESLSIEVKVTLEDLNGQKFEYLPVCWTYMKDTNDWFYEPTGDC